MRETMETMETMESMGKHGTMASQDLIQRWPAFSDPAQIVDPFPYFPMVPMVPMVSMVFRCALSMGWPPGRSIAVVKRVSEFTALKSSP